MAMVHPSRMALVPQDPKVSFTAPKNNRGRSPSPLDYRRRSPSRERDRYREGDSKKDRDLGRDRHRDDERDRHSRSSRRDREHRESDERRERDKPRRASPEYNEYRRPSPPRERDGPVPAQAPWRHQDNMYPRGRDNGTNGAYGGGADFMERYVSQPVSLIHYRRLQRESMTVNVWPPSPKEPARELFVFSSCLMLAGGSYIIYRSPHTESKRHKKSHKRRHDSDDSDTDSEEERRRRRKERKKARREKEKDRDRPRDRERRRPRSRSRRYSDGEDSEEEREKRTRTSRSKSKGLDRHRSRDIHRSNDDEWVEKPTTPHKPSTSTMPPPSSKFATQLQAGDEDDSSDDDEVGPKPVTSTSKSSRKVDERQYGGALLRGEGSAMAAFLRDGTDVRIPRRGEIGLASDEIASYESVGYVMSGSRHRRMNAVRMRKENQVISAEEKRGILKLQQEERERREAILREEFQQLVTEKLKSQGAK
ncbi:hypothetical protein POSPLADRAFT_1043561 [Postia placenta MAD-698-R-SB12]|uniref:NF-kappa-B-activating protein C-terminal domain-containing protein n=1 Tax=Postia placenta MAD-698-R-SB12 TaxID=670580 RepID=A0A1X6NC12_9APHY|nr:hypothetical protein POSPLADRAFT_1043561 [Postia placenta MAD-698-R-SB12]OSX66060.1 hypothetical protein POSPLADRAFT_1043561 [Postia placenta MAD-698-R-SB12]